MNYFAKRLLISVPLLLGITLISFAIMRMAPGDPATMFSDPRASIKDMEQVRHNLGLDKPILVQYFFWLKNIVSGNLGYSYQTGKPVLTSILERMPATLLLSLTSLILVLLITLPLGLISGAKKGSRFDNVVTILSFLGLSIPTFWLALVLILTFSLNLNLFPTSGFIDASLSGASFLQKSLSVAQHLVLPLCTVVVGELAGLTRYHRFGIISILGQDYIKAAKARGVSEGKILFRHAFKNAALPLITILGLDLPSVISGSFIIEFIFAWPGMGQLGIAAVFARDYPILMGSILFSSILIIVGNLFADVAYAYVDPRIRKR
jgi:peptide/nickel transport system permease protein